MTRRAPARLRPGADGDEGAALLTVIMLMFIVGALSVLVLGAVVSQVRPTVATQESSRTVFAAEAGVQTALSQIRSATSSSTGQGDRRALPCTVSGSVDGTGGRVTFTATVGYYSANPTGQSDTWLASPDNQLTCTTPGGPTKTPSFAVVHAAGADTTSGVLVKGRELQAVYTFNVVNQNVAGGLLMSGQGGACLQADSGTEGSLVHYVDQSACRSDAPLQQWVYDTGYHLALAGSVATTTSGSTTTSSALCLTRPLSSATDRTVTLQRCTVDSRSGPQLWTYEGGSRFRSQTDDNSDYGDECLGSGQHGNPVGRNLVSTRDCSSNGNDYGSFIPEAKVGAGAASMRTSQIVNFLQFGRCMDVTYENIFMDRMIVYPCKQDPSGRDRVFWNHKWFYGSENGVAAEPDGAVGASTRIRVVVPDGTTYCLTTPVSTAPPSYPVFRSCDGSSSQRYTRTYDTGDLATSYQFRTSDGRCLSIDPVRAAGTTISSIVAAPCTGGAEQKWNAPADAQDTSLTAQTEVVRRS